MEVEGSAATQGPSSEGIGIQLAMGSHTYRYTIHMHIAAKFKPSCVFVVVACKTSMHIGAWNPHPSVARSKFRTCGTI